MLLLYDAITSIYTQAHFTAYSCVDVCECTNQVSSCDHPTQMLLLLIAILSIILLSMSVKIKYCSSFHIHSDNYYNHVKVYMIMHHTCTC